MAERAPEILDLDKLIDRKRAVTLVGKEIDVSKIPSKISLEIIDIYEDLLKDDKKAMEVAWSLVMDIIHVKHPDITREWLVENTDIVQLMALFDFILKPVKARVGLSDEGKNMMAALVEN
ncbi:MAG: hypothetical protein ACOCRU_03020 [bacterium]